MRVHLSKDSQPWESFDEGGQAELIDLLSTNQSILAQSFSEGFIVTKDRIGVAHQTPALFHTDRQKFARIAYCHLNSVTPAWLCGHSPIFCSDILEITLFKDLDVIGN